MKITKVDVILMNMRPADNPGWAPILCRVYTDAGIYGDGEAALAYGNAHRAAFGMLQDFSKSVLGMDPLDNEVIWEKLYKSSFWGQNGGPVVFSAISAIDTALWDIKGKMANMPLYQLFGGKCREGVPVYRHVDGRDLSEICENIAKYREIGVKTIRCQCGGYGGSEYGHTPAGAPVGAKPGVYLDGNAYIRDTVKLFDGIRSKMGDEIGLVHDVHERIAPADAVRLAKELEPYHLTFLEDPVSLEQVEYIRQIKNASSIPIAEGELFNNPYEYRTLITERLIDYIRVHITQVGGITPARKLQIFAEQFGVRTAWHGPGDMSPLAHAANVHIDLAAPNFGVQEWSGIEPPNFVIQKLKGPHGALLEVFPGLPEYKDGYVYANDKPGLGVDLIEKEAEKYPCENTVTTWTQTRRMDGALQTP